MTELDLRTLSDCELRIRLKQLAAGERRISSLLLRHLAEYDRRELYREDGCRNLWTYCAKELKFSETEISLRIHAARAVVANPELLGMLERGETTISSIGRLAPHLKNERRQELIEQVKGKTVREVRWLVATEKAAEKAHEAEVAARNEATVQVGLFDGGNPSIDRAAIKAELVEDHDRIVPLSGDRARLEAVVSRDFVKRLERAQVLLARRFPRGRVEEVMGLALELLLDKEDPGRRDTRRRERAIVAGSEKLDTSRGRFVSRRLRDRVLQRDGGRCCALEADGSRCTETRFLEIDHKLPLAKGGKTTYENLQSVCQRHHGQATIAAFGKEYVQAAIRARRNKRALN